MSLSDHLVSLIPGISMLSLNISFIALSRLTKANSVPVFHVTKRCLIFLMSSWNILSTVWWYNICPRLKPALFGFRDLTKDTGQCPRNNAVIFLLFYYIYKFYYAHFLIPCLDFFCRYFQFYYTLSPNFCDVCPNFYWFSNFIDDFITFCIDLLFIFSCLSSFSSIFTFFCLLS